MEHKTSRTCAAPGCSAGVAEAKRVEKMAKEGPPLSVPPMEECATTHTVCLPIVMNGLPCWCSLSQKLDCSEPLPLGGFWRGRCTCRAWHAADEALVQEQRLLCNHRVLGAEGRLTGERRGQAFAEPRAPAWCRKDFELVGSARLERAADSPDQMWMWHAGVHIEREGNRPACRSARWPLGIR